MLATGVAAAGLAAPAAAGPKSSEIDAYCSPTGDYCLQVLTRNGRVKFGIRTFSFKGRYEICVKSPAGHECATFKLDREGDTWTDRVDWARNFAAVPGRYRVVWKLGGTRLGEALRFRVRGPVGPVERRGYWRKCGTRVVGEALLVTTKSHAVRCRLARRIAAEYAQGDRTPIGFRCSEPDPGPSGETQKGVCRREGGRVKVVFGI